MISNVEKITDFVDVDTMLENSKGQFNKAIVIGYQHDGHLNQRTTGTMTCADVLWMLEQYKIELLSGEFSE